MLSDNKDISSKKYLTCKANCMLHTFSYCDPVAEATLLIASLAPTKYAMTTFSLCSNVGTGLLTGMTMKGSVTSGLAGLSKGAVLSCQSFDNASKVNRGNFVCGAIHHNIFAFPAM